MRKCRFSSSSEKNLFQSDLFDETGIEILGELKDQLFAGSPSGAKAAAVFYSLIAICQMNKIEPYQYLCKMLHQIRFVQDR